MPRSSSIGNEINASHIQKTRTSLIIARTILKTELKIIITMIEIQIN